MRAVAINVGANTNEPGFRGPVRPDGRFEYVPIPESKPTVGTVPTYGDLAPELACDVPDRVLETPVHLDPTFAGYPRCERYTYGDPHPVKAGPLSELVAGDYVLFYATLTVTDPAEALPPTWGAFIVGQFRLARDPVTGEDWETGVDDREAFAGNAHLKRDPFDARVMLAGDPDGSALYERCVPLSRPSGGTEANRLVTDLSADSGRGPWWRRALRFDEEAAPKLLAEVSRLRTEWESYQA